MSSSILDFIEIKRGKEFFRLKQFGKTIIKLRELADFVFEFSNFEEYLCFKFEEGLTLEIWKKMFVSSGQSYKEVVPRFESKKVDW